MRPVSFTFPGNSPSAICASQTTSATGANAVINGSLRDYAALNVGVQQAIIGDGIQRTVTITSAANISTSTFTITGYDVLGNLLATTLGGPNATTVSTTTEFELVTAVTVGTTATQAFTVGTGSSGTTNWVQTDTYKTPFAVTVACNITTTGVVASVQDTPGDPNLPTFATGLIFTHPTLNAISVSAESNYAYPARFIRSVVSGLTASGAYTFTSAQAG
jgi:hypothetical protein